MEFIKLIKATDLTVGHGNDLQRCYIIRFFTSVVVIKFVIKYLSWV